MDISSIVKILSIFMIVHYAIAIYCIIDMFTWHRISVKWRCFWIIVILLNTILLICYFIFRKQLHQQYVDKENHNSTNAVIE
jgi:hypothetical protein